MKFKCPCCNNELPLKDEFLGCKIRCVICQSKFKMHLDHSLELLFRSKRSYLGPQVTKNIIDEDELQKMEAEESFAAVFVEPEPEEEASPKAATNAGSSVRPVLAPKIRKPGRRLRPGETAFSWTPVVLVVIAIVTVPVSVYIIRPELLEPAKRSLGQIKLKTESADVPHKVATVSEAPKAHGSTDQKKHLLSLRQSFGQGRVVNPSEKSKQEAEVNKLLAEYVKIDKEFIITRKKQLEISTFNAP